MTTTPTTERALTPTEQAFPYGVPAYHATIAGYGVWFSRRTYGEGLNKTVYTWVTVHTPDEPFATADGDPWPLRYPPRADIARAIPVMIEASRRRYERDRARLEGR